MAGNSQKENVMCCFCGNTLKLKDSVSIQICLQSNKKEKQNLFCHKNCLIKKLDKSVPIHPDLLDD